MNLTGYFSFFCWSVEEKSSSRLRSSFFEKTKTKKHSRRKSIAIEGATYKKGVGKKDCLLKKQEECLVDRLLCFIIYMKNRWNFLFFATLVTQNMKNIKCYRVQLSLHFLNVLAHFLFRVHLSS